MKKVLLFTFILSAFYQLQAQTSFANDSIQYLCASTYRFANVPPSRATVQRSDTIDLLHIIVSLSVNDFAKKTIGGNCELQFRSKMNNIGLLVLDLQNMAIDSVKQNGQTVSYTYTDSVSLNISLLNTLQQGDSAAVTVYYHGHPVSDNTLFGGFFYDSPFAYNVGVSPSYLPHMLGRAWHPCFDNFVERATYDFHIITSASRRAMCNGVELDSVSNGDGTVTWNWHLAETIPSYLASIAVGPFTQLRSTLNGINAQVPVILACSAPDSAVVKNSFTHLPEAFAAFEDHYGPYRWNRVGFNLVPVKNVAMEHATNIAYPIGFATGSTANENLYVHELAHHWFGNVITPSTAEDYWLKEGWAVYSEKIFYEAVYGHQRYLDEVATFHELSVHYAHIYDGYLPVSPIPQQYTYGKTVYNKASDMAHVMETYVGAPFFQCLKNYFSDNAYTDQDSYSFRDYMSNCSGVDLTDYFNDWIFSPGFPHFSIDSFEVVQNPTLTTNDDYEITVHLRQRLDHAPHYFHNVPIEVTFMSDKFEQKTERILLNGPCTTYKTHLSFNPVFVCSDLNERLQDAISENYFTIKAPGAYNYNFGKMNVEVHSISDSAFLRIEHNFVAPDSMKTAIPGLHLSQERYWRVDGVLPTNFDASASIIYNGKTSSQPTSSPNFYLDMQLITNVEDSLA